MDESERMEIFSGTKQKLPKKFEQKCVLRVVNACFVCAEHDEWKII